MTQGKHRKPRKPRKILDNPLISLFFALMFANMLLAEGGGESGWRYVMVGGMTLFFLFDMTKDTSPEPLRGAARYRMYCWHDWRRKRAYKAYFAHDAIATKMTEAWYPQALERQAREREQTNDA